MLKKVTKTPNQNKDSRNNTLTEATKEAKEKAKADKVKKILDDLNKDISYFNTSEVLGAIKIMKKYVRPEETPYIVKKVTDKNGNSNFKIRGMIDDYFLATNNILKLGIISCAVYNKEYGFQFFDPFNMMFTREEKEKFGLE